jgi:RNA polymerase sigma factor for flagellar operon FliA
VTTSALSADAKALVEAHLPLVRHVLAGVAAHFPRHADREELAQAASLGLVEAAARFDVERGVPFDRWAALRIRGAILDAVRALDFAPRALRAASREVEAARNELTAVLGRTPTSEDIARHLGIPVSDVDQVQGQVHRSLVLSLDAPCGDEEGDPLTLASGLIDDVQRQPVEVLEQRERSTYVRDALACLPDRLKDVVVGYFLEGESSADIAARLGVTESRVSQMRTDALKLMRAGIEAQYEEASEEAGDEQRVRGAHRAATYAAALASRSSYSARLSHLPQQRRPVEDLKGTRAAG